VMRRWLTTALVGVVLTLLIAAFPAMAWIRNQQGHEGHVYPSEIEGLAVRKQPADPLADARNRGSKIFGHYCQMCHGPEGKGDGLNSTFLKTSPRDFTDREFWEKRTTRERTHDVIGRGGVYIGKSVLMPAWERTLTKQEISDVAVFIRDFATEPEARGE